MTLSTLLLFVLASALAIVTPGPTVLLALNNGSRYGVRAACWGMAGAVAADVMLVTITAAGLGVLLAASEFAFRALKWAGAAYGLCRLETAARPAPEAGARRRSRARRRPATAPARMRCSCAASRWRRPIPRPCCSCRPSCRSSSTRAPRCCRSTR